MSKEYKNEINYQNKLQEKYNINNLFNNKTKNSLVGTPMIKFEDNRWYKKITDFLNRIFRRHK